MKRRAFLLGSVLLTACGALPWITTNGPVILAVIQDALIIVGKIETWLTNVYFPAHPDAAKEKQAIDAIDKVKDAIDGAANLLGGGIEATQAQLDQAEAKFTAAWNDLMALVGPLGVKVSKPGQNLMLSEGEQGLVVEEPKMLHLSGSKR